MERGFIQFVDDLKAPESFKAWGPALALLEVGNFDGLVAFGRDKGYTFTAPDVKTFLDPWPGGGAEQYAAGVAARTLLAGRPNTPLLAWARSVTVP